MAFLFSRNDRCLQNERRPPGLPLSGAPSMIQQRTGFVPRHTGQNHCSAAAIGLIKHIITKRKCKITWPGQRNPANHQKLERRLQNEAVPLFVFYCQDEAHMSVNGCTSTHTGCVSFTLIHFTQGSQWVHQEEAECDEGLLPQGLSSSQVIMSNVMVKKEEKKTKKKTKSILCNHI